MVDELGSALNASIADLADFFRVKLLPLFMMEFLVEFADEFGVDKVDEGIAHIALVLNKRERVPCNRWEGRKNRIFF